jgi:hypothetical protein
MDYQIITAPIYPAPWLYITNTAFVARFAPSEVQAVEAANTGSPLLAQGWTEFSDAAYVWLCDPRLSTLLNGYVAAAALTAARAAAILSQPAQAGQHGAPGEGYYGQL